MPNSVIAWVALDRWLTREETDGCVVYQPRSGDTHYVNHVGAQALRRLKEGPIRLQELCAELVLALGLETDATFESQVGDLLTRFDELGLVVGVSRQPDPR